MQPQFVAFFNLIFFSLADLYNLIISHLLSVSCTGFFFFFFRGGYAVAGEYGIDILCSSQQKPQTAFIHGET